MERDATVIEQAAALVGELAGRDVSALPDDVLMAEHAAMAKLGRLRDAAQARYDAEIARRSSPEIPGGGLARSAGYGNVGKMISQVTGGSMASARRSMEAGEALARPATPPVRPGDPDKRGGRDPNPAGPDRESALALEPAGPKYPAVAQAAMAGELSVDAAGLITSGLNTVIDRVPAANLHEAERRLVERAKTQSAQEVRRAVALGVARMDPQGLEERQQRQYENRHLSWTEDHTGTVTLNGRLDPVTAAPLRTVIEQMVTAQFRARRDQDPADPDTRTVGQMRADAMYELCRHSLGCDHTESSGVRTTVVVRMGLNDLMAGPSTLGAAPGGASGAGESGAGQSVAGAGVGAGSGVGVGTRRGFGSIDGTAQPISVGQLRRLTGDAGLVPEVLGGDSEVLDLGRRARFFTRAQRLALTERDGGCAKCHAPPEHCEAHHIIWWDHGGRTDLDNGVMLCTRCHHDVHRQGWEIVVYAGRVSSVPPPAIDPRQRPRPGGTAAIDVGDVGPPTDEYGCPLPAYDWHPSEDWRANDPPYPRDAWALTDAGRTERARWPEDPSTMAGDTVSSWRDPDVDAVPAPTLAPTGR